MKKLLFLVPFLLLVNACTGDSTNVETERKAIAEHYLRGVYGCDSAVVDDLAGDGVVISYPIFEELFSSHALRGRKAVKEFSDRFCSRWEDARITVHDAVADGDSVFLLWSFSARFVGSETGQSVDPPPDQVQSWGGITLYRFDEAGKIVEEVGEESAPGPFERLAVERSTD